MEHISNGAIPKRFMLATFALLSFSSIIQQSMFVFNVVDMLLKKQ